MTRHLAGAVLEAERCAPGEMRRRSSTQGGGRPVIANRDLYEVLEQMHWLCFHLEFEHPGDPDLPCTDPSCAIWQRELYRSKLLELGLDPDGVLNEGVARRYG